MYVAYISQFVGSDVLIWHIKQFQGILHTWLHPFTQYLKNTIIPRWPSELITAGLPQDGTWAESANLAEVIVDLRS